jgi:hypothetical protein
VRPLKKSGEWDCGSITSYQESCDRCYCPRTLSRSIPTNGICSRAERMPLPVFGPEDFTLSDDRKTLTCPDGGELEAYVEVAWDVAEGKRFRDGARRVGAEGIKGCGEGVKSRARAVLEARSGVRVKYLGNKGPDKSFSGSSLAHPADWEVMMDPIPSLWLPVGSFDRKLLSETFPETIFEEQVASLPCFGIEAVFNPSHPQSDGEG